MNSEFLTVWHDKFEFRIPAAGYRFNENDVWVRLEEGVARVGVSDYLQQRLTDIGFFDPPAAGAAVEQFGELGTIESAKAAFEIISPVSGTVKGVNAAAARNPGLINEDPYGAGWLVEVSPANWPEDAELLLDGPGYAAMVARKAEEESK